MAKTTDNNTVEMPAPVAPVVADGLVTDADYQEAAAIEAATRNGVPADAEAAAAADASQDAPGTSTPIVEVVFPVPAPEAETDEDRIAREAAAMRAAILEEAPMLVIEGETEAQIAARTKREALLAQLAEVEEEGRQAEAAAIANATEDAYNVWQKQWEPVDARYQALKSEFDEVSRQRRVLELANPRYVEPAGKKVTRKTSSSGTSAPRTRSSASNVFCYRATMTPGQLAKARNLSAQGKLAHPKAVGQIHIVGSHLYFCTQASDGRHANYNASLVLNGNKDGLFIDYSTSMNKREELTEEAFKAATA